MIIVWMLGLVFYVDLHISLMLCDVKLIKMGRTKLSEVSQILGANDRNLPKDVQGFSSFCNQNQNGSHFRFLVALLSAFVK